MKRLGERIKRKREVKHMQLNDLAKQVGITSSALSQIENAKAFPSILTLHTIADRLHTTVGEIIGEHETLSKNPLLKNSEKKFVRKTTSGTKIYLLSHHDPHKQMETYLLLFAEESDANEIMTNHPGQEFCYLNEGAIEIILDEKTYVLKTGDSFYFNSSIPHSVKNIFEGKSEMIWIITPPNI